MNRNEARKKVLRSWDQDLSTGNLKWPSRDRKNMKMVNMFSKFVSSIRRHVVDSLIWNVFESQMALEIKISRSKINFGSKCYQKFNSNDFKIFKISYKIPCQFLIFSFRSEITKFNIYFFPFWSDFAHQILLEPPL